MSKKKNKYIYVKLISSYSSHFYIKKKKKNSNYLLNLIKYDPFIRKHVFYLEKKK